MSLSSPKPLAPVPSKRVVNANEVIHAVPHHPSFASCTVLKHVLQFLCLA